MQSFTSILFVALLLVCSIRAQSVNLFFTATPSNVQVNVPVVIGYKSLSSNDSVTILLRQGDPDNLQTIATLTDSATDGTYTWTPAATLVTASDYALEIIQGDEMNYSGEFSIAGVAASTSSVVTTATSTSTVGSTSTVTLSTPSTSTTTTMLSTSTVTSTPVAITTTIILSTSVATPLPIMYSPTAALTTTTTFANTNTTTTSTMAPSAIASLKSMISAYNASLAYYSTKTVSASANSTNTYWATTIVTATASRGFSVPRNTTFVYATLPATRTFTALFTTSAAPAATYTGSAMSLYNNCISMGLGVAAAAAAAALLM